MWFKRKKKADSDSALTDTLRSLQTLLDEDPAKRREKNNSPPRPSKKIATQIADPSPGATTHSVVSEEHLTWDFDVDLSTEESKHGLPNSPGNKSLQPIDGGNAPVAEIADSDTEGTSRKKPDISAVDTIPVLNNIVFLPTGANTPSGSARNANAPAMSLIDLCIEDIRHRLVRHALPALDPTGEQQLRTFLTSLLDQEK